MKRYFIFVIILLMSSIVVNGCSTQRGGFASSGGSDGVSSDDTLVPDLLDTIRTDDALILNEAVAPNTSLTVASDSTFKLQGLVVQGNETTNYTPTGALGWTQDGETIVNVARITLPNVSLTVNSSGEISAVKANFADKTYSSNASKNANIRGTETVISDATIATLTVDRNDIFGFATGKEANYMAYIGWNLERTRGEANPLRTDADRSYRIYGNMIAGIETERENIPVNSNGESIVFTGKGRGYYNHVQNGDNYATIFDVKANVNFSDNSWLLYTENTNRCATKNDYSDCEAETTVALDFGTPDYDLETPTNQYYAINELRSDVALVNDSTFSGTIYGYFYGEDARELGGIFTMRGKTDGYYYGAFGAERAFITLPFIFNPVIDDQTVNNPITPPTTHKSLYDVAKAADDNNADGDAFKMQGLTVYKNDGINYTRAPNREWLVADQAIETNIVRVINSAASLIFNGDGYISGVTIYTQAENNSYKTYSATAETPTSATTFYADDTAEITVDREIISNFSSNYMAYISWDVGGELDNDSEALIGSNYDINGAMLAGIETTNFTKLSGIIEFNGKGSGTYKNTNQIKGYRTVFDVTATVDFDNYVIDLTTGNTQCVGGDSEGEDCHGVTTPYYLDFNAVGTTALSFANDDNDGADNDISRTLGIPGSGLAITLDARFYGDVASEFGGTFALTDNLNYYYGVFGAERKGIVSESKTFNVANVADAVAVVDAVTPSDVTSLTAVTFAGVETPVTMKALSVYKDDRIDYTVAPNRDLDEYGDSVDSVDLARVSNSSALLTFNEDGNISGITVNWAYAKYNETTEGYESEDKSYIAMIAIPDSDKKATTVFTTGAGDADNASITVDRSEDLFGFDTDYMAYIDWNLTKLADADSAYDISGSMIAGIEATDLTYFTGDHTFQGKGRGTYQNLDDDTPSYDTIFDVTAEVDFTNKKMVISSRNTCQAVDCDDQPLSDLNFTTPTVEADKLSFAGGNIISGAVTTDDLAGTLDARFYGKGAGVDSVNEFGGTFALSDTNADNQSYYYGAFGATRNYQAVYNGIAGNSSNITTLVQSNKATIISFDDPVRKIIHDDSKSADDVAVNLRANTVELVKDNGTQTITINKSHGDNASDHGSAVQLSYLSNGDVRVTSLALYFANNQNYSITAGKSSSDVYVDGYTIYSNNNDVPDYLGFNRRDSVFGFESEHMALIHWRTQKADYESRGYSITGFDTKFSNLPTTGDTKFTGRGEGQYYDTAVARSTYFTIIADVNFVARTVELTSDNTCISLIAFNCGYEEYQRDDLDFEGNLSYVGSGKNVFKGNDFKTKGDTAYAALDNGSAEARFFGTKGKRDGVEYDDAAKTFGGTFYLYNGSASYIGYFGALRSYISSHIDIITDLTAIGAPATFNDNTLTGFNDPDRASTVDNALQANAVQITKNTFNQTIFSNRFTEAVVEFDYDADGDIADSGHLLYLTDVKYERTSASVISGSDAGGSDANRPSEFSQTNGFETFSFDANYMAITQWQVADTRFDIIGYALNGFANAGGELPTPASDTGTITFVGEGHGRYYDADTAYNTDFIVQADVNFFANTVVLEARNTTCDPLAADALDCLLERPQLNDFNFDVSLSYDAGENILSSTTVATKPDPNDDFNYASLTGTLEAKFYGTATNAAKEFGGTFAMQNSAGAYIGYFGAAREYAHSNSDIATDYADTPETENLNPNQLVGFNNLKNNNTSNNALPILSAVQVTKNDSNETITSNKITGAVVEIDYIAYNEFANTGLTLYVADKKYEATAGTGNLSKINATTIVATMSDGTADIPTKLQLNRSIAGSSRFAYMANIYWQLDETLYSSYGYGITGYETDNITAPATPISGSSNIGIPAAETGIITFTGRGQGRYAGNVNFATDFDIVADVDFDNREVALTGTIEGGHALNFNSTLSYAIGMNSLTGSIATAGGADYARLSGTAEAKFYGPHATDLGGTFTMFDDHVAYIGWFGAQSQRDYRTFPAESMATTHDDTPTGSDINTNGLTGFNDSTRGGTTDNALPTLLVQITGNKANKLIYSEAVTDAVVKFDFQGNKKFKGSNFFVYFADKKYQTDVSTLAVSTSNLSFQNPLVIGSDQVASLQLETKGDYMALVSWSANSGDDQRFVYGMNGFETLGTGSNSIPTTGTSVSFTGSGSGTYYNQDATVIAVSSSATSFDVTATVDFTTQNVNLTSEHSGTNNDHFNITASNLSYTAGTNNITGTIETATGDDQMTGTANARFYGPSAAELGGIFSMQNDDIVYIGWFGADR